MTTVFADTFYFLALANARDLAHQRAVAWTAAYQGKLLTTVWVLTEFGNHMSDVRNRAEYVSTVQDLRSNPQVVIIAPDAALFDEGFALYARRPDKEWSLTDCISFVVMQRENVAEALTGDRDFEQAGFVALLK
jgi:predicted nucleic acid-binding protein